MTTRNQNRTTYMVQLAVLIAIIIALSFSPIGYIRTLGVQITTMVIPVTIGAIILGPKAGAILGFAFGMTSFIQCFGLDPFGTTLLNINPVYTFIMCFVPRIIMGWLTGIIYVTLRKRRINANVAYIITCVSGPLINTMLFVPTLLLFFFQSDYIQELAAGSSMIGFAVVLVGFNALAEAITCAIIGVGTASILSKVVNSNPQSV